MALIDILLHAQRRTMPFYGSAFNLQSVLAALRLFASSVTVRISVPARPSKPCVVPSSKSIVVKGNAGGLSSSGSSTEASLPVIRISPI